MERVKIYNEAGTGNTSEGIGFFAEQIMKHNPLLPCEENGRLNDVHLRENFVMRVLRWMKTIRCIKSKTVKTHWHFTAVTTSQSHLCCVAMAQVLR